MTLQAIKYGAAANDGTGDSLREAMRKTQQNFEYLDQGKVDKVAGMGLSSNNFTNDERVKLANIQSAATKNLADAILLGRENHTGGFNGFGAAYLMRNHDALPLTAPPSAYFGKGSFVGFAMGVEVGIPGMGYGIGRVDAHWADATSGYGVMRSFEGGGGRRFTSYAVDANTWSDWLETSDRKNLQGTQPLSTITGVGTAAAMNVIGAGGIIEQGSNSNGEYVKFADGTMICSYSRTVDVTLAPGYAFDPSIAFAGAFVGHFTCAFHTGMFSELGLGGAQVYSLTYNYSAGSGGYSVLNTGQNPSQSFPGFTIGAITVKSVRVKGFAIGRWK